MYTIDQLTTLEAAIATGALEVSYGDKKVRYQDLNDMLRLRYLMRDELGLNATKGRLFASFSKGFYDCNTPNLDNDCF